MCHNKAFLKYFAVMMNGIHCEDKYDYESLWPRHFKSTLVFLAANVSLLFCHVSWALNTLVEIPLKN